MYVIDFNVCNRITRVPLEERRRENTIQKQRKRLQMNKIVREFNFHITLVKERRTYSVKNSNPLCTRFFVSVFK